METNPFLCHLVIAGMYIGYEYEYAKLIPNIGYRIMRLPNSPKRGNLRFRGCDIVDYVANRYLVINNSHQTKQFKAVYIFYGLYISTALTHATAHLAP